ncbi:SDR family oxidoreductase [Clostridium sp. MB40-C1]|uniref:SDR family NAD(P)-dependent oxidoreductase n=1 Tax=Clostridium sp. MB40-C1 TaxID=3070996 RepID=UPI0027DF7B66|nr:SDR family oxidoreductase [Clostridium sp. MB40-C1]WMJ80826.1 SDR family oxidoreductase [Clostridium sp. MB40-C1]
MVNSKGKNVLITGASSGIGYELAKVFAKNNYNLILVARRLNRLEKLKESLSKEYDITVKIIGVDLTKSTAVEEVFDQIKNWDLNIDILVNNAGIGTCGFFSETDSKQDMDTIELNISALTKCTKFAVNEMLKKENGKILNVASTGAYQPGPLISVYYATKAYVVSFSEAIYNELKPHNITVSILCPGTTSTEFSQNAGKGNLKNAMSAKKVAEIAYEGLMKNKKIIIPGTLNKFLVFMSKIIPRSSLANIVRKIQSKAMKEIN